MNRKVIKSTISFVLAFLVLSTSTITVFAGDAGFTSYTATISDDVKKFFRSESDANAGVLLHDDHEDNNNLDVYVENIGEIPLYVRIKLKEYLKVGENVIAGKTESNKDEYTLRKFTGTLDADGMYSDTSNISKYFSLYMSGGRKLFRSGKSNDNSTYNETLSADYVYDYTKPEVAPKKTYSDGTYLQYTLPQTGVITMAEYVANQTKYNTEENGRWILDTDGYAYWSKPLESKTATNMFLDNAVRKENLTVSSKYAINVSMEAVSIETSNNDLGIGEFEKNATVGGQMLIDYFWTIKAATREQINDAAKINGETAAMMLNTVTDGSTYSESIQDVLDLYYGDKASSYTDDLKLFAQYTDARAESELKNYEDAAEERANADKLDYQVDRVLISYSSSVTEKALENILDPNRAKIVNTTPVDNATKLSLVDISTGDTVDNAVNILDKEYSIDVVGENHFNSYSVSTAEMVNDPFNSTSELNNGMKYSYREPLDAVHVADAWQYISSTSHNKVLVAVLDAGMDFTHEDFSSANLNKSKSRDVDENGNLITPDFSKIFGGSQAFHGLSVVGTIIETPNNAKGSAGVATGPNNNIADVMFVTAGDTFADIKAIGYCADQGAKVLNMSFGTYDEKFYDLFDKAVKSATAKGMLCVCAAGNSAGDVMEYPQGSSDALSVSAVGGSSGTDYDVITPYTSYGNTRNKISAPGMFVLPNIDNKYWAIKGTSFSSPMVAGIAAMMLSVNSSLTPEQVKSIMFETAEDLYTAGYDKYSGAGRIDAYRAVRKAKEGASDVMPPNITSLSVNNINYNGFTINCAASDNQMVSKVVFTVTVSKGGKTYKKDIEAKLSGSTFTATADIKDFNFISGSYTYQITATASDVAGNKRSKSTSATVPLDTVKPTINSLKISNVTSSGFTITCNATDNAKVNHVVFKVYPDGYESIIKTEFDSDNSLYDTTNPHGAFLISQNGSTFTANVSINDFLYCTGSYMVIAYAYDGTNNESSLSTEAVLDYSLSDSQIAARTDRGSYGWQAWRNSLDYVGVFNTEAEALIHQSSAVKEQSEVDICFGRIQIKPGNKFPESGGIRYKVYNKGVGWSDWGADGETAGVKGKQIEGIKIELTGNIANSYSIVYSGQMSNYLSSSDGTFLPLEQEYKDGAVFGDVSQAGSYISSIKISLKKKPSVAVTGISVSPTSKTIYVDDKFTITPTITPSNANNKTVTWSSSNTSVATVSSSGVVTGKGAGTATITAKSNNGKTATCKVTVKKAVAVTSVTLNKTSATLNTVDNKNLQLVATVKPDDATDRTVTWSSSDSSVAKVSTSGLVTALKAGTATITATSGGKSATCKITVKGITYYTVNGVVTEKYHLPDGTKYNGTWVPMIYATKATSSNTAVAKTYAVAGGMVTELMSPGTATINTTNSDGSTSVITVTVKKRDVVTNNTSSSLALGDSETVYGDGMNPRKALSMVSSNTAIVSPNSTLSGYTGNRPGTAILTIKWDAYTTEICTVTVRTPVIRYKTSLQSSGWTGYSSSGGVSGTTGQNRPIQALNADLSNNGTGLYYRGYVSEIGWQSEVYQGNQCGTIGRNLEAVQIRLTGATANCYDVYYRVYSKNLGWLDWAKNGATAGTTGFFYHIEAIQIQLVSKGGGAPGATTHPSYVKTATYNYTRELGYQDYLYGGIKNVASANPNIISTTGTSRYSTLRIGYTYVVVVKTDGTGYIDYVTVKAPDIEYKGQCQTYGWTSWTTNGSTCGYSGKRLEGLDVRATCPTAWGSVQYRAHCQTVGWQSWVSDGQMAGTQNQSLRMEAIEIRLTSNLANNYNIQYRAYVSGYGWQGWVSNGATAGTTGQSKQIEQIQIRLVAK